MGSRKGAHSRDSDRKAEVGSPHRFTGTYTKVYAHSIGVDRRPGRGATPAKNER